MIATNGSMQADAFLFQALVEPGDVVVVEAPTYDRTLLALRQMGAEVLAIPLEADGIDVEALEQALEGGRAAQARPRDPQLPQPGRLHAVAGEARAADRAGRASTTSSLFEDDPYVELRFEGEQLPTMLSIDEAGQRGLRVVVLEDRVPGHPRRLPRRARPT